MWRRHLRRTAFVAVQVSNLIIELEIASGKEQNALATTQFRRTKFRPTQKPGSLLRYRYPYNAETLSMCLPAR